MYVLDLPGGAWMEIDLDTDDAEEYFDTLLEATSEMDGLLSSIADVLRMSASRQFRKGGDPPWRPLAASTLLVKSGAVEGNAKAKAKAQSSSVAMGILIASGALRDSWTKKSSPDHVETTDPEQGTVEIGSALPYADVHQQGRKPYVIFAKNAGVLAFMGQGGMKFAKSVNHPGLTARPVRITEDDTAKMEHLVAQFLKGEPLRV